MAKYHVGQKLWLDRIYDKRAPGREVTVKTVGRKWVTLDDGKRFEVSSDLPTSFDWGGLRWRVFESQEHATRYRRVSSNWSNLVAHLRHMPMPADMTTGKIIDAAELLGISYEVVNPKEKTDG